MSRVQNLLPTVPTSLREVNAATTGQDFDDVLARTFEDRPRNAKANPPVPRQGRAPVAERPANPDRPARADEQAHRDSPRPEQHKTGSRPHLRGTTGISRAKGQEHDPADVDDAGVALTSAAAASDEVAAGNLQAGDDNGTTASATTGRQPDQAASTDIVAGSVTGVIVDPALLAAMVTTAPTLLTRATAPEPEAGMSSVAAVDGGTAIIVTAPVATSTATSAGTVNPAAIVAAGTELDGVNPDDAKTTGTGTGAAWSTAVSAATAASATSGAAPAQAIAATTPADPAAATGPATTATPTSSGTSTAAASTSPSPAAGPTAAGGTPVDAAPLAALTRVAGTAPPISATLAGVDLGIVGSAMGIDSSATGPAVGSSSATGGTANPTPAMNNADTVPTPPPLAPAPAAVTAAVAASAPVVDPVAAALAGAYGTAASGATGDRPTGPIPSAANPDGTVGALTPNGTGSIGAGVVSNDANGTDTGQTPDHGSGARFGTALDEAVAGSTPAASTTAAPAAVSTAAVTVPAPGSTGVPVAGTTGVNGVSGTNGTAPATAADPVARSAATTQITDQVAAQVGRQLQGARMREGTHHTVLRLSPEHLGEVTITLDVRARGVRLDLSAAPLALAALQADLGRLRDDLAGSGLDLGAVTLTAQDAGPGTNGQATARDRWQEQTPTGRGLPGDGSSGPTAPHDPFARRAAGRTGDGGLDVLA